MKSFAIGKLIFPEVFHPAGKAPYVKFSILVGRDTQSFTVSQTRYNSTDINPLYDRVVALKEFDKVLILVGYGVSKDGRLACYLNDLVPCDEKLSAVLKDSFMVKS